MDQQVRERAAALLNLCREAGLTMATVESCTGGLVIAALTEIAGSSAVVERGFITYTYAAKSEQVGVPGALLKRVGAVSEEVARAMATGALAHSPADLAVSVTGVAGPGPSEGKPAGLVHIAGARRHGETIHARYQFEGDRSAVRRAAVLKALDTAARLVA